MEDEPLPGSLIKLSESSNQNLFLMKLPQWLAESLESCKTGTVIGDSDDILDDQGNGIVLRLDKRHASKSNPTEFNVSLPSAQQNLRVLENSSAVTIASNVTSTLHLLPKRDEKYSTVLKDRLEKSEVTKQHRTLVNQDDFATSRTALKLVQFESPVASPEPGASPAASDTGMRISAKRFQKLEEVPQKEARAMGSTALSLDDSLMETLVNDDHGWALQQLTKALKDKGVTVSMSLLKSKLLEICVYQRRGDDTFPKYYLKSEYKN